MIEIHLDTVPPSLNSAYKKYHNRVVLSQKAKDFKQRVLESAPEGLEPMRGNLKLSIRFCFRTLRKRDLDNYLKVLIDSIKGIYFEDDDQIYEIQATKELGVKEERTEITVEVI